MASEKDRTVYKDMDIDGNLIIENWKFMDKEKKLTYDLDKCVGCSLCYVVCPDQAIELGPIPEIAQNLIEDMPPVLIDTDKCSFCFMCDAVCINSVYEITDEQGNEIDKSNYPKLEQMWIWDEETCKFDESNAVCIICSKIRSKESIKKGQHFAKDLRKVIDECPTGSMKFKSPFEGEVVIFQNQLDKCDPNGCKACVNICPTESFFIPQTAEEIREYGKIACNEETCMYCGACENACPEEIIMVKRHAVDMKVPEESKGRPWLNRWKEQFNNLTLTREELKEKIEKEKEQILIKDTDEEILDEYVEISPKKDFSREEYEKQRKGNEETLRMINDEMSKANVRYFIHLNKDDKLRKWIKKRVKNHKENEG